MDDNLPKISLTRLFEDRDDPRVVGCCTYPLVEVVLTWHLCRLVRGGNMDGGRGIWRE